MPCVLHVPTTAFERSKQNRMKNTLTPAQRVLLARDAKRPNIDDYINKLFDDFVPLCGDRAYKEDASILGGIALYKGLPVTVIGHRKGKTLEENIKYNFGMTNPAGYRKAQRLMRAAEKFARPVITFVDTPGAYPGMEAENHGQGEAIASCLTLMSELTVPIISVITGEGGSGGALALSCANKILMLENAIFSVLSPEGFSSILWKDATKWQEAADIMKLTSFDLKQFGIADEIIKENNLNGELDVSKLFLDVDSSLQANLNELLKLKPEKLKSERYLKMREIGSKF